MATAKPTRAGVKVRKASRVPDTLEMLEEELLCPAWGEY